MDGVRTGHFGGGSDAAVRAGSLWPDIGQHPRWRLDTGTAHRAGVAVPPAAGPRRGGAGRRSDGRLSERPSTNKKQAEQADVSARTIRRAKAQIRAKDKSNDASTAGSAKPPLRPAAIASIDAFSQSQAAGRIDNILRPSTAAACGTQSAGRKFRVSSAVDADKLPPPARAGHTTDVRRWRHPHPTRYHFSRRRGHGGRRSHARPKKRRMLPK